MKRARKIRKTKFIAYVAASIDGRISLGRKEIPNWTSAEDKKFFQSELRRFDAVVVGRNTYEAAKKPLEKRNTYVLSSRVRNIVQKGSVMFLNPSRTNIVKVFAKYNRVAVLGGGKVYQTMLDKKLLNEIYLTLEPLVFGRGVEMFVGGRKIYKLNLLTIKKLNKIGTLLLRYKIVY